MAATGQVEQQVAGQQMESAQHIQAAGGQQDEEPIEQQPAERAAALEDIHEQQEQQQQQQVHQQQQPDPELQLDLMAHPELSPLADAAFTLAALASSGLAAPYGLPRNDTLAVRCLRHAALAGGVDAQLALADRWGPGQAGGTGWKEGRASSISGCMKWRSGACTATNLVLIAGCPSSVCCCCSADCCGANTCAGT